MTSARARFAIALLGPLVVVGCGGATSLNGAPDGGGGIPPRCSLPADPGNCLAYMPAYYHDEKTDLCTPFVYGGCGGNDNRFATQQECQAACPGGVPDRSACAAPSDCILASPGCCAACDPVDQTAFVALNRKYESDYVTLRGCNGVQCGPCQSVPEEQTTRQNFFATCERGHCVAVDVRTTPVTECSSAADCSLRDGAACCEGCDGAGIVSIASLDALQGLACDAAPHSCPGCVTRIPPGLAPACTAGRCGVARVAGPAL